MQWRPFQYRERVYDLAHLHPRTVEYAQPAKGTAPERIYRVDIRFGLHCFTRGRQVKEASDSDLHYADERETRIFDFERYELSKYLPDIIAGLERRKCFHTGKGNFFSIEIVLNGGGTVEYDIFFVASRSALRGRINLFVQSAYVRDKDHSSSRPAKKPIGFYVILFNTLHNRPIKIQT